jgi:hypothetical protein
VLLVSQMSKDVVDQVPEEGRNNLKCVALDRFSHDRSFLLDR